MPNILCVIPARKGSVSVPDKNIRSFCGIPLFLWSVCAAMESRTVTTIAISSNYSGLKELFAKHFAPDPRIAWIDRPDNLCQSDSSTEDCLLHALSVLETKYDWVVTLQPTSPIRRKNMIDIGVNTILPTKYKSLLSVEKHTPFFFQTTKATDKWHNVKWHFDRLNRKMRQQMTDDDFYYHDDGSLYVTQTQVLVTDKCRLDPEPCLMVNAATSRQIDTEDDFLVLEALWNATGQSGKYVDPLSMVAEKSVVKESSR